MDNEKKLRIAVDGPSGSGKSSLAKAIARRYGYVYIDTGALYRTVGLYMSRGGIDAKNAQAVEKALPGVKIEVSYEGGAQKTMLGGEDVSAEIRRDDISLRASEVSAHPAVRAFLLGLQRSIAENGGVVMDGRDIGTVIMPDAEVKIFLTASPQERARRRYEELRSKGQETTLEAVRSDMEKRDKNDSTRSAAPAVAAPDAVTLDNTGLDEAATLEAAVKIIEVTRGTGGTVAF